MSNVIPIPEKPPLPDLLVGPFEEYRVQVEGRIIPGLTGYRDGEKIALVIDHRFSASFAEGDARQAAWLIAQAMAISQGYPWLGAPTREQPFAPFGTKIGG